MVSDTYTRTRTPERHRAVTAPSAAFTLNTTGTTGTTGTTDTTLDTTTGTDVPVMDRERHDATQMWNWSATAVMWGYGPSASDFL
ncbi:hypothetical protein ACN2WE_01670 [Streptomyces sp. cg28]|uniref:hypothetical protein n=1 Tax=Streptomyces sp. cg28 TaxID=3403457 RepID=UPI003B21FB9E